VHRNSGTTVARWIGGLAYFVLALIFAVLTQEGIGWAVASLACVVAGMTLVIGAIRRELPGRPVSTSLLWLLGVGLSFFGLLLFMGLAQTGIRAARPDVLSAPRTELAQPRGLSGRLGWLCVLVPLIALPFGNTALAIATVAMVTFVLVRFVYFFRKFYREAKTEQARTLAAEGDISNP
jgi:hypothetical protein